MESKRTFTIVFPTRKSRSGPNQLSIYVRITVAVKRSEIGLKRNVHVAQWDSTKTKGRGSSSKISEDTGNLLERFKERGSSKTLVSGPVQKNDGNRHSRSPPLLLARPNTLPL